MKLSLCLILFLPVIVTAQPNTGNPKYDFPEIIIRNKGTDSMLLIFDEKGLKNTIMTSVREAAQAEIL
jgi:hypothetical protein